MSDTYRKTKIECLSFWVTVSSTQLGFVLFYFLPSSLAHTRRYRAPTESAFRVVQVVFVSLPLLVCFEKVEAQKCLYTVPIMTVRSALIVVQMTSNGRVGERWSEKPSQGRWNLSRVLKIGRISKGAPGVGEERKNHITPRIHQREPLSKGKKRFKKIKRITDWEEKEY